ncbi:MAG TPA: isochorismatase family protein [Acidobacteriaceae bacterium]|jgi:nicotinamidase-related amidase
MPISQLDAQTALVIIDLQKGIVSVPTVHPTADIVARSAELARAFRERGLPVVLVNVDGVPPGRTETPRPKLAFPPDFAELVPELEQQPDDILITKKSPGAFLGTALDEEMLDRSVTQVVFTGVSTSVGVEASARSAFDLGYNVVFAVDAMTDRDPDSHAHSVEKVFKRIGETGTTEDILKLLSER